MPARYRERVFEDRHAAGRELAAAVVAANLPAPRLVLGLPRGGVPVAYEVAQALKAPLDVLIVRKIGVPYQPELAMGAIASGGVVVHEPHIQQALQISSDIFEQIVAHERAELARREQRYRAGRPPLLLRDQCVVLVDDGIATGATMRAAVHAARIAGARHVAVAAPVAASDTVAMLRGDADAVIVLQTPTFFQAIGQWYEHFDQLTDDAVCDLLAREQHQRIPASS
jgi:predicted phosphoribosyltransferase